MTHLQSAKLDMPIFAAKTHINHYKSTKHQENYHPSCSQPCPFATPAPTALLQVVYASAKEALNKQLLETMLKLTHPDSVRCRQRVTVVVVVLGVSEKALIGKGFCE